MRYYVEKDCRFMIVDADSVVSWTYDVSNGTVFYDEDAAIAASDREKGTLIRADDATTHYDIALMVAKKNLQELKMTRAMLSALIDEVRDQSLGAG